MALKTEPIIKPAFNAYGNGHWGPKEAFFYKVKDGEHWGSVAQLDGWGADVKGFIRYNFGTDNPYEVNWFLKNYVGCTLQTEDKKNYRFSSKAKPGYIFTRKELQPQPNGNIPPPINTPEKDDEEELKGTYGPARAWLGLGGKAGGMIGPRGGDGYAIAGISLSGPPDTFFTSAFTYREGAGIGGGAGLVAAIFHQMQHPNQLFDCHPASGWDYNIGMDTKFAKYAAKIANNSAVQGLAKKIVRSLAASILGSGDAFSATMSGFKSLGFTILDLFGEHDFQSPLIIDIPGTGPTAELAAFKGYTYFVPMCTRVYFEGAWVNQIITPWDS